MAVGITLGWIAGILLALRQPTSATDAPSERTPAREQVVQLALPIPYDVTPRVERPLPPAHDTPQPSHAIETSAAPHDTGATTVTAELAPSPATSVERPALSNPMAPSISTRLLPARPVAAPWYSAPQPRNPFGGGRQRTAAERDSILGALGPEVPQLAAERRPTQGEVDARSKEAMLKMRLTGRVLLVPPDNSGGLITGTIPVPFLFGRGPSKATNRRDSATRSAGQAILERLRQRADSLTRVRNDSAARHVGDP